MSWVEASDAAITAVHDATRNRPYAMKQLYVSPQMLDQAMHPADLLKHYVDDARRSVDQLLTQRQYEPNGDGALVVVWVQAVHPKPRPDQPDEP